MSIPNIDFFAKLITFLGLSIVVISGLFLYTENNKLKENEFAYVKNNFAIQEMLGNFKEMQENQKSKMSELVAKLRAIHQARDSGLFDNKIMQEKTIEFDKEYAQTNQFYEKLYSTERRSFDSLARVNSIEEKVFMTKKAYFKNVLQNIILLIFFGAILFISGINLWTKKEQYEKDILIRQNLEKPTYSKNCQSCGKVFDSLITAGSEENGNKNYNFCRACYKNGVFTNPDMTFLEIQQITKAELETLRIKPKAINRIIKEIAKLDRWKINKYI